MFIYIVYNTYTSHPCRWCHEKQETDAPKEQAQRVGVEIESDESSESEKEEKSERAKSEQKL